jgi:CheY-like chemotaxis protein/MinD-like ATPase involved in chromosome partitioning or flagellar assembly
MAGSTILVVDADAVSLSYVSAALQEAGHHILRASSAKEGLIAAWRDRPDLIVIDPVITDMKGEDFAVRLRSDDRTSKTPLIALSRDTAPSRSRACLQAGFNEYLVKTAKAIPSLLETIERLSSVPLSMAKEGGILMVFLSAKGGTGTSSLCANIAMNIASLQPEARVAVADIVLPIGSIAEIVGYDGSQNLVTIAEMPASETTPEFFRNNLTEMTNWRFHLLAGSPDPESGNQLNVGRIGGIVRSLKLAYDFVLLDIGRTLSRISLPLIQNADLAVMIVSTDLSTITLTKTVWDYLQTKGLRASNVYTILNRAVGLEGLTRAEAEKIIGIEIKTAMPYLGGNFALANNLHQPLTTKFPNDTAAIILRDTSQQMVFLARRVRSI